MTRRTLVKALATLCTLIFMMMAVGAENARAQQNPNCCTYTVDRMNLLGGCVNIRLTTKWDCNGTPVTYIKSYSTNGITIEPIGAPLLPPCPPACKLVSISLDNVNFVGPNVIGTWIIGNCCYKGIFSYDAAGCIYIKVRPC